MITASKIKKLKKDKSRLITTVAIAADKLSEKKLQQGRREAMLAMVEALVVVYGFGKTRIKRVTEQAEITLSGFDIGIPGDQAEHLEAYLKQRGVL